MPSVSSLRARLGLIMVGVVLVVCAGLLIRQRFFPASSIEPMAPVDPVSTIPLTPIAPAELQAEWQTAIASILADYDRTGDARSAKERMLTIRVPATGRDAHLALFLAFMTLSESRPEGKASLVAARAAFASSTTPSR